MQYLDHIIWEERYNLPQVSTKKGNLVCKSSSRNSQGLTEFNKVPFLTLFCNISICTSWMNNFREWFCCSPINLFRTAISKVQPVLMTANIHRGDDTWRRRYLLWHSLNSSYLGSWSWRRYTSIHGVKKYTFRFKLT